MKFGVNTSPYRDLMQELEALIKMNPDFIEFKIEPPGGPADYIIRQSAAIKKFLSKHNITATAHAPWWIELGSPDVVVRATWIAEVKRIIDACAKIGATILVVHGNVSGLGFVTEREKKRSMATLADSFSFLNNYGSKKGVTVTLENTWETPAEFAYILKQAKDLKVTIDIAHAYLEKGTPNVETFLKRFKDRIVYIQISDNGGTSDDHEEIGNGKIPWRTIGRILKDSGYDGGVVLEVFKEKAAVKRSLKKIRRLWQ